jgi:hypothetical protein
MRELNKSGERECRVIGLHDLLFDGDVLPNEDVNVTL